MVAYLLLEAPQGSVSATKVSMNERNYIVIGVSPLASNEEIQTAYKKLMKGFHPDMAFSPEAKREFEKRSAEINEAYTAIKKERQLP
jgi:DnaJ-class molecular chaperone